MSRDIVQVVIFCRGGGVVQNMRFSHEVEWRQMSISGRASRCSHDGRITTAIFVRLVHTAIMSHAALWDGGKGAV